MDKVEEATVNVVVKEGIGRTKSSFPDQIRTVAGHEVEHLLPSNEETFIDIKNGKRSKVKPKQVQEKILPPRTRIVERRSIENDSVVRLDETTSRFFNCVSNDVEHFDDDKTKKKKTLVSDRQMQIIFKVLSIINFMLSISLYVLFFILFFTSLISSKSCKNYFERRVHDVSTDSQIRNAEFSPKGSSMVDSADKISWNPNVQNSSFVRLGETGERIFAKENGTYSIFVSLTVDSFNCKSSNKTRHAKSMICLRASEKAKCAKVTLSTESAITVSVREDIFLQIDDFFWVSGLGFDCGDPEYTYMTIIKYK